MFDIILRVVSVYFSFVKNYDIFKKITISDKARAEYVSSISSEKRKLQSIAVWKLLEYALKKDYSVLDGKFVVNKNGAWALETTKPYFSLSHSDNLIAVAVSDNFQVGVDCEIISPKILKVKKLFSNLKENEFTEDKLTLEWTKKESLYKNNKGYNYLSNKIFSNGNYYYVTVCTEDNEIKFNEINFNGLI